MDKFLMGIAAAHTAAGATNSTGRRNRVLSIIGVIAIAMLIGVGLFIVATHHG
jgi:hypothetical protein